jgi:uracil-DNA glycosylase
MKIDILNHHHKESLWAAWETLSPQWKHTIGYHMDNNVLLRTFKMVDDERARGIEIYPRYIDTFRALNLCTPMNQTKVVILGQDPYHGPGQANGLAFSVNKGQPIPPSLRNIFLELKADLGYEIPAHGDLTKWAKQGVLLLNTALTVEKGKPASHANLGWADFVNAVLSIVGRNAVGILWGKHASQYSGHFLPGTTIVSPHPSPFSADKGFFGSKPFSQCNVKLHGLGMIDWSIE